MLRLITFGGLSVMGVPGPNPAPVPRRQLALLALLACSGGRGMSREKLFAYLWPESDASHARHALNQSVYSLRHDLDAKLLRTSGGELRLDTQVIDADVIGFEAAMKSNDFENAVAHYAGLFLDGFFLDGAPEFERWAETERARLAKLADLAMESLARAASARGDHHEAATQWLRLAARDPLNSRVALETMRSLATAGNRATALRHGERHTALLKEELDAAPDAHVLALMSRLRGSGEESAPALGAPQPTVTSARLLPAPDVLRERYQRRVARALADRYRMETQHEGGSASTAFRALALPDGAPVTVRIVQPALAALLDVRQFVSAMRRLAELRHDRVARVLDAGECNEVVYYVTEPLEGATLRARLKVERQFGLEEALDIACDLAAALTAAHSSGIWHLDLKPRNVLLRAGHGILLEAGIAPAIAAAAPGAMTRSGVTLGTPAYMSPEQVAGEDQLDGRSDVYSFGCVLYHMLAGAPPFAGPTAQAALVRRLTESPPSLRSSRGEVPAALERILVRMLARVPADRPQTMADVERALRQLRSDVIQRADTPRNR